MDEASMSKVYNTNTDDFPGVFITWLNEFGLKHNCVLIVKIVFCERSLTFMWNILKFGFLLSNTFWHKVF